MKFDDIKKLHQKKYRQQFGYFLAEGEHPVLELQKAAQHNPLLQRSELYVTSAYAHWQSDFKIHVVDDRHMAQLSDTQTPQGIIALVPVFTVSTTAERERVIYLHEIQDPGNLGTILRTLAWFGASRCLLSPGSVDPYNSKVVRSSMGAIFHVPIELDIELDALPERFARIACLDMQGESIQSDSFKDCDCYLFGNEARGLPRAQLTALNAQPFTISGALSTAAANVESLNLATAVNICVYELYR